MPDELRLRRYEPRDQERVLALEREALESVDARPDDDDWADDLRAVRETYLDAGGEFLVGELGGDDLLDAGASPRDEAAAKLVAMGGLKRVDATTAEVTRMRVAPDHHRKGFGEEVLLALEERAADLGYETLELETTARQEAAQSLYEKHGYECAGTGTYGRFELLSYRKLLGSGEPESPTSE
ncbi:N-acetyltransferase [Halobacteriales archaeon SW_6_65_15]|jgi:ribosomal protein S18 acetylase RimI-like enzyme|nr:MAG: N-acetyltransferase [Halobacteriales archaeon SW_6_65_15]